MARNAGRYTEGYVAVGVPPSHHRDVLIPAFEAGAREAGEGPSTMMKCARGPGSDHPKAGKAPEGAPVYGALLIPGGDCVHQRSRAIEQTARRVEGEALRPRR